MAMTSVLDHKDGSIEDTSGSDLSVLDHKDGSVEDTSDCDLFGLDHKDTGG